MIGKQVGPYTVVAKLGEGGMGEVYRARDTKLNRDVAIKVLPVGVAADVDRLARFRREAEVLAALNHPAIAQIYGLEGIGAEQAIVMELVDGEDLSTRIARAPMPIDEALAIARQVAHALDAAHEKGIVHRDLKPANVKITEAGQVKVLDFGLAKAVAPDAAAAAADLAASPTLTARATAIGVILGTAAYMAPEQAKGRAVDRRADIWAFGAVLFEMLSGRRAFGGDDVTEVLASVIKTEPQWDALPEDVPPAVRRLLRRCLEKDPRRRLRDIAEGMLQLDEGLAQPAAAVTVPAVAVPRPLWRRMMPMITAIAATAALVSAFWMLNRNPHQDGPVRVTLRPPGLRLTPNPRPHIGITPDGKIMYRAGSDDTRTDVVLKLPDQFDAEPLAGAGSATTPFVSPDGEWVGFVQGRPPDNLLFKVPIRGGPRTVIATSEEPRVYGAAWAPDDTIVFGTMKGLFKIPPGAEKPVSLTTPSGAHTGWHVWPTVVGSTGLVVFAIRRGDDTALAAVTMSTGAITPLAVPGTSPRYLPTGHIAYATSDGVLRAVPFDAARIAVTGPSIPLETGVHVSPVSGAAEFDVSASGTLAYISADQDLRTLVWVDRQQNETAIPAEARLYTYPRLSPDDQRLSVAARAREQDILTWEFARPGLRVLVRNTTASGNVLWASDGTVLYALSRDGRTAIYRQNADGTGQPSKVVESERSLIPQAMVPDGSALVVGHGDEIALVRLNADPRIETLGPRSANASLSPNGAWLAYESSESREVFVRPFPRVNDGAWPVSSGPGSAPLWSRSGRELFYIARGDLMSAAIEDGPSFRFRTPTRLLSVRDYAPSGLGRGFDVAKDGRFLMLKPVGRADPVINVVYNWFGEVAARVKPRRVSQTLAKP